VEQPKDEFDFSYDTTNDPFKPLSRSESERVYQQQQYFAEQNKAPYVQMPATTINYSTASTGGKAVTITIFSILGGVVLLPLIITLLLAVFIIPGSYNPVDDDTPTPSPSYIDDFGVLVEPDYVYSYEIDPFTSSDYVHHSYPSRNDAIEELWKSGENWLEAPESEEPLSDFYPGYPDVNEYLNEVTTGNAQGVHVVVSSDPEYNCGLHNESPGPETIAGCYDPSYGNVIFMWWGPGVKSDLKVLELFHQFSHYAGIWDNFDIYYSLYQEHRINDEEIGDLIERDATCKVYIGWNNSTLSYLDSIYHAPCGWAAEYWDAQFLEYDSDVDVMDW